MSQLGEFLATIQNNQDVRTAAIEERLSTLEGKEDCGCAETIATLEARLAELESKDECGCAETITALEERLATLESKEECGCAETITALEQRLATLESKEECGCGSYDELLASYEERISALEGNTGGGSTEGEGGEDNGGSTEGEGGDSGSTEGEGENNVSTEPIPASQALEKYNHILAVYSSRKINLISAHDYRFSVGGNNFANANKATGDKTIASLLGVGVNEGDIVKVYTPDLQEIEIIADATQPYYVPTSDARKFIAFCNKTTKEIYYYDINPVCGTVSPYTDEDFIAQWGNSDAFAL